MPMSSRRGCIIAFFACVFAASSATDAASSTTDAALLEVNVASKNFDDGFEAFLAEHWDACVGEFEASVSEYRRAKDKDTKCRLACQMDATKVTPMLMEGLESLPYVEELVNKSVCLRKCTDYHPGLEHQKLKSYEYLQYCYFQKQLPQKAATAVYTYLAQNPENSAMLNNLRCYVAHPEVTEGDVVNLEPEPFIELFLQGADAFESSRYAESIVFFERSLDEYLNAEESCRARCDLETPTVHALPTPNYIKSVARQFMHDLKCKRRCPLTLATTNRERHQDVLPKHYLHLHLANDHVGNMRASCEALASYLLFRPRDPVKLAELSRLESQPDLNPDYIKPREEANIYVQRQDHEGRLLRRMEKNFESQTLKENSAYEATHLQDNTSMPSTAESGVTNREEEPDEDDQVEATRDKRSEERSNEFETSNNAIIASEPGPGQAGLEKERISNTLDFDLFRDEFLQGVTLEKSGTELGGQNRLQARGLATEEECKLFVNLAQFQSAASQGSSHRGEERPLKDLETFEALTVGRLAKMVHQGRLPATVLDTFLEVGDRGRMFVKRHFKLDQKLYFHFSHLVCRQAAADDASQQDSMNTSLPILADNCMIEADGQCSPEEHSGTASKDYSAIVYLNDDFEGGEFVFARDPSEPEDSIQAVVQPACGRMVAFSSGRDNLHTERGLRRGKRCTMGLWFTLNPAQNEEERVLVHMYRERTRLGGGVNEYMLRVIQEK